MSNQPELIDTPEAGPAVIRGGVLRTASFVAGLALSTFSAPLIVRHLGEAEYGRYCERHPRHHPPAPVPTPREYQLQRTLHRETHPQGRCC